MKKVSKITLILLLSLGILHLPIYPQSRENGAIQGRVAADTGEFLPGTEIKLSSPNLIGGDQFAVTDESGKFRFVALPPGTYSITATLEGFTPTGQEDIRLHAGTTLTIDLILKVGRLTEEVVVVGEAPLVDIKSSETGSSDLPIEFLQAIPNTQNLEDAIDLAPGVTDRMAYGGISRGASNTYMVDGANLDDPGDGAGYRLDGVDYNVIEEAKMSGIGANAEYDGFSGAVFSVVTKSGGNELKGDINFLYQNTDWSSDNTGDTGIETPAAQTFYDVSAHLGGPLIKDKLWFFAGIRYGYRERQQPGFPQAATTKHPLFFSKLTWQPNKNNRFRLLFNLKVLRSDYRGGGPFRAPETTTKNLEDTLQWNINWLHIFSDQTFVEAKYAGWKMNNRSTPKGGDIPGHIDYVTKWRTVNNTDWWQGFVWVHNVNVTVSHYAADFLGSHDFKLGVDAKVGGAHDQNAIPGGKWYLDYEGQNFYRYDYVGLEDIEDFPLRYNVQPRSLIVGSFAQDSWSVTDRLTINIGLRYNYWRMKFQTRQEELYKTTGLAPRIGFSYDLFGDHSTALKAHYGRYFDKANFVALYALPAANADMLAYKWEAGNWVHAYTIFGSLPGGITPTSMDQDIKHPSLDQFSIGISRELAKDLSFELTYIHRNFRNILETVNLNAEYEKIPYTDPYTGAIYEVYNQTNNPDDNRYLLTNPYAGQTESALVDPTKKYNGLQIMLNKRFSNNWQLRTSYMYSTLRGTYDNIYAMGIAYFSRFYKDPNYQHLADGKCTFDPTHVFKVQGMVVIPVVDINLGANFQIVSGYNYNRNLKIFGLNQGTVGVESWGGTISFNTEEKGSRRMPTKTNLDIRLEKFFMLGDCRFGLTFDVFNVFNSGTPAEGQRGLGYITEAGPMFETIDDIVDPRSFRIGARFYF